ncbi:MAG: 5-bromo-4-chloroindolyl phosphate hydrolysis family protein [Clostridia bacterium]|nr:5-bromo-4-chloroindolyl phosphate hydrolysis family protein [Clostridia bacterium]
MSRTYNGRFESPDEPQSGLKWIIGGLVMIPIWPTIFGIPLSIGCFIKGGRMAAKRRMYQRFHEFCAVIGMRERVPVRELAKVSHMGKDDALRYLQRMIAEGYFGEGAYLDVNRDELVLPPVSGYEARQESRGSWKDIALEIIHALRGEKLHTEKKAKKRPQADYVETDFAPEKPKPKKNPEQLNPGQETARQEPRPRHAKQPAPNKKVYMDELERTLNELYELNEKIENEAVSQRIDRIGTLTAGIFGAVIDNPAREQDVRRFMNYYLPQTLKLLKSYEMLEEQHYQSENIVASRQKIEKVLDMLIEAYEKQLDRLFHNDALDIATDIDVLETMMAGDGLSQKGSMQLKL